MGTGKEKPREKEINAVSSQTVKSVLPDVSRTELSLEELERMGQKRRSRMTILKVVIVMDGAMHSIQINLWNPMGGKNQEKEQVDGM